VSIGSSIEWTEATWNPVRGCAIVSPGCTNCYAMKQAHRFSGDGRAYAGLTKLTKGGPVWTGKAREVPELIGQPAQWRAPRRIFVNSMSDLFHEDVSDDFIARVFATMADCPRHTFQILTKRPQRMRQLLLHDLPYEGPEWPLKNVWLGVSTEDQVRADERIPLLLETPAAVRWISAEPLLGPVLLDDGVHSWLTCRQRCTADTEAPCDSFVDLKHCYRGIDWVVAGGESGPGARPMHPDWARSLRDQCAAAGVPFFFKQWGNWAPCLDSGGHVASDQEKLLDGTWLLKVGKKSAGRELDGRTHDEYPTK
jgi:protein gp37